MSTVKKQEAAAEIAATEATLEILQQQEHEIEELQRLESEEKRRVAEQEAEAYKCRLEREEESRLRVKFEAENAARRKALEDKRRELERLETLKKLNAAKARMKVNEQTEGSKDEAKELLHDCVSVQKMHMPKSRGSLLQHTPPHKNVTKSQQEDSTADLVRMLAESISSSRLPIPEPATFYGDPLRFSNWKKISFQTLIDRKNIPVSEKIYFLRKYVEGPAKKAIESYFILGSESAYHAAWAILEERYGNPFVIAKAFRDKLNLWPKIGPKDSVELREFTDFLRGCEAAMVEIKSLQVLNDCNKNQKILSKLPDWLALRWNRQVIETEEETKTFPTFSQFVEFLAREAKIAFNPVTSLHALKCTEVEKGKVVRNQGTRVKVLAVHSSDKPGHAIHKCWRFTEKNVSERIKFVQMIKLCFGCLKPGHHSKNCDDRSVCDAIGVSHRIIVKQVMPSLPSSFNLRNEVKYICRTHIKEIVTPTSVIKALKSDFIENASEHSHVSQEDLRFLSKMKTGTRLKENGHYEMPLPFKEDGPKLPYNKDCAMHRLRCLEKILQRDEKYYKDYIAFINETIARGDAEKVPVEEIDNNPAWYIPHHGVYHPQKPGQIRVVFDCSAKYHGTSLNEHLLSGPELTNTLIGVLCRFRKGPVAIMCDIERMFHQFHVKPEDQDYLRFLWWEKGDLESQPQVYRMREHLFGAASSPGCANYGLKHLAAQGRGNFSETSVRFIERNFYVDDGLTSVSSASEAIQLSQEARELAWETSFAQICVEQPRSDSINSPGRMC